MLNFTGPQGDSTSIRDRIRAVPKSDDGSSNVAGIQVATGAPLTFSYFVKPASFSFGTTALGTHICLYHRPSSNATIKSIYEIQQFRTSGQATGLINFRLRLITAGSAVSISTTTSGVVGDVFHICATIDRRGTTQMNRYLYLNGVEVANNTVSTQSRPELGTINSTTSIMNQTMIGAGGCVNISTTSGASGCENYLAGDMGEIAIWENVLSVREIQSLAKGFRPSLVRPSELVYYVPGVRGISPVVAKDNSGNTIKTESREATVTTTTHDIRRRG